MTVEASFGMSTLAGSHISSSAAGQRSTNLTPANRATQCLFDAIDAPPTSPLSPLLVKKPSQPVGHTASASTRATVTPSGTPSPPRVMPELPRPALRDVRDVSGRRVPRPQGTAGDRHMDVELVTQRTTGPLSVFKNSSSPALPRHGAPATPSAHPHLALTGTTCAAWLQL